MLGAIGPPPIIICPLAFCAARAHRREPHLRGRARGRRRRSSELRHNLRGGAEFRATELGGERRGLLGLASRCVGRRHRRRCGHRRGCRRGCRHRRRLRGAAAAGAAAAPPWRGLARTIEYLSSSSMSPSSSSSFCPRSSATCAFVVTFDSISRASRSASRSCASENFSLWSLVV